MKDESEFSINDMADLAEMAIKIRRFLNYLASSYSFFVYSLGVLGPLFIAEGLWEALGGNETYWVIAGILIGVILATYLHTSILSKVAARVSREKSISPKTKYAFHTLIAILVFLIIGGIASLIAKYLPGAEDVSWYPSLGLFLLLVYFMTRSEYTVPHLIASIIMLLTSPIVLYTGSYYFAIGFLLISYLIAGIYGAYKALEELGG